MLSTTTLSPTLSISQSTSSEIFNNPPMISTTLIASTTAQTVLSAISTSVTNLDTTSMATPETTTESLSTSNSSGKKSNYMKCQIL